MVWIYIYIYNIQLRSVSAKVTSRRFFGASRLGLSPRETIGWQLTSLWHHNALRHCSESCKRIAGWHCWGVGTSPHSLFPFFSFPPSHFSFSLTHSPSLSLSSWQLYRFPLFSLYTQHAEMNNLATWRLPHTYNSNFAPQWTYKNKNGEKL